MAFMSGYFSLYEHCPRAGGDLGRSWGLLKRTDLRRGQTDGI